MHGKPKLGIVTLPETEMTNSGDTEECDDVNKNVIRPTFLPLSLKGANFSPTLPDTAEHEVDLDNIGITDRDMVEWDIIISARFKKTYFDDEIYDVFSNKSPKSLSLQRNTTGKRTQKVKFAVSCKDEELKEESKCCSQWLRAYLRKLWVKGPTDPKPETSPKHRQITILEREFSRRPKSPKGFKRTTRKRHNATSQYLYSAFFEDCVQELREERHDDVVYAITVKKDTLPRSGSSSKSLSEVDIMKEKNISRHLKGATLDHMVGRLARVFAADGEDANFLNVFLTTYRTFSTPVELLTKLTDEYMKLKAESPVKNASTLRSIVRVLRVWLERYSVDDFYDAPDHQLLRRLLALARVHDGLINDKDDDVMSQPGGYPDSTTPPSPRSNGVVFRAGFADYVAAKLAVAIKVDRTEMDKPLASPMASPTHTQNPDLDIAEESFELNAEPAKQLLLGLSSRYLAAQLTVIDAKLFHRVQPHHCLAAVASSKNRPVSVRATIDQFNRVVYCVVATVLCPSLKLSQRTRLLTKWIEVAQECRELKNFSSLRAIVSGLQTYALHRLKRAWAGVPTSHSNLLKELAELNMKDLIMKVGTAKVNTEDSSITRVRKDAAVRRHQDMYYGIMHGTVPYLGSFLTDLIYLDTARPNFLEGGFINFEKRRKEFELLAQLQLWQASCRSYQHLEPEPPFMEWFQSYTVLTEEQTFLLSEMIEPPITSPATTTSPIKKTLSEMFSAELDRGGSVVSPAFHKNIHRMENGIKNNVNKFSQSLSGSVASSSPGDQDRLVKLRLVMKNPKVSDRTNVEPKDRLHKGDLTEQNRLSMPCEYKTITISSNERTTAVIKKALECFRMDVETNLKRFSLVQLLNDGGKDLKIPDSSNVFYAMSSSDTEPTLVLLEEGAEISNKVKRHQSTPLKAKKHRHRKNHSMSMMRDSDACSSRASRNFSSVAASPMKSLYSIAFGPIALAGGSYSPSQAARRTSDGDEATGNNGIVLLNSRASVDDGSDTAQEPWPRQMRASMSDASHLNLQGAGDGKGSRPLRCYSADYTTSVVLPIRVVKPSETLSSKDFKASKSAPCSPQTERRNESDVSQPSRRDRDVITATSRLTEWPRYSQAVTNRSATWSSRRPVKKTKKSQSRSTFYVRQGASEDGDDKHTKSKKYESPSSKFYVDLNSTHRGASDEEHPRGESPSNLAYTSRTLPPGFSPDFTGHDYEERELLRTSTSLESQDENKAIPLSRWGQSGHKHESHTSLSSGHSIPDATSSDSGSCIVFVATPSEDNVFDEDPRTNNTTHIQLLPAEGKENADKMPLNDPGNELPKPPVIKIQCASPEPFLGSTPEFAAKAADTAEVGGSKTVNHESGYEDITYL